MEYTTLLNENYYNKRFSEDISHSNFVNSTFENSGFESIQILFSTFTNCSFRNVTFKDISSVKLNFIQSAFLKTNFQLTDFNSASVFDNCRFEEVKFVADKMHCGNFLHNDNYRVESLTMQLIVNAVAISGAFFATLLLNSGFRVKLLREYLTLACAIYINARRKTMSNPFT